MSRGKLSVRDNKEFNKKINIQNSNIQNKNPWFHDRNMLTLLSYLPSNLTTGLHKDQ